jgi:hypothetical protein
VIVHSGSCHCGAIRLEFHSDKPLAPRACQCRFCRKHRARSVSDSEGQVVLTLDGEVQRYRFGLRIAEYLICGRCGVYVSAVAEIDGATYAILNLNAFENPHPELEGTPFSYDGESAEQRNARRRQRWTPARIATA